MTFIIRWLKLAVLGLTIGVFISVGLCGFPSLEQTTIKARLNLLGLGTLTIIYNNG